MSVSTAGSCGYTCADWIGVIRIGTWRPVRSDNVLRRPIHDVTDETIDAALRDAIAAVARSWRAFDQAVEIADIRWAFWDLAAEEGFDASAGNVLD